MIIMTESVDKRATDLIIKLQNEVEAYRIDNMLLRRALDYSSNNDLKTYAAFIRAGTNQLEREFPELINPGCKE